MSEAGEPLTVKAAPARLEPALCGANQSALQWSLLSLPIGYLWFHLVDNLRVEWGANPQYSYGWMVPFLMIGLIRRRWQFLPTIPDGRSNGGNQRFVIIVLALLAFLYLPTRLIESATPQWRPIQWMLALETVGLTLGAIFLSRGPGWLSQLAFPICFLFVAVPWPSPLEAPIIQAMSKFNTTLVVEIMGLFGIPAIQHGNVIEIGNGLVGIDDACSGIRSFQSSIMISFFFGEFYRFDISRRLLLVPLGFLIAFALNICRTTLLTWVAARRGIAAIAEYHDPAGVSIAIACTLVMWVLALVLMKKKQRAKCGESRAAGRARRTEGRIEDSTLKTQHSTLISKPSVFGSFSFSLLAWLVAVEVGVQLWYRGKEAHLTPTPNWTIEFPRHHPGFKGVSISSNTKLLLRFDDGKEAAWKEDDGTEWQAFYFNWNPGKVAGYLAKRHTPEICLAAAGCRLQSGPELMTVDIKGVLLPIRSYIFKTSGNTLYVFHCRWEQGGGPDEYVEHESTRYNSIRAIWAGRGNQGQKVFEFITSGYQDAGQAKEALVRQLEKLIQVEAKVRAE